MENVKLKENARPKLTGLKYASVLCGVVTWWVWWRHHVTHQWRQHDWQIEWRHRVAAAAKPDRLQQQQQQQQLVVKSAQQHESVGTRVTRRRTARQLQSRSLDIVSRLTILRYTTADIFIYRFSEFCEKICPWFLYTGSSGLITNRECRHCNRVAWRTSITTTTTTRFADLERFIIVVADVPNSQPAGLARLSLTNAAVTSVGYL